MTFLQILSVKVCLFQDFKSEGEESKKETGSMIDQVWPLGGAVCFQEREGVGELLPGNTDLMCYPSQNM